MVFVDAALPIYAQTISASFGCQLALIKISSELWLAHTGNTLLDHPFGSDSDFYILAQSALTVGPLNDLELTILNPDREQLFNLTSYFPRGQRLIQARPLSRFPPNSWTARPRATRPYRWPSAPH